MSEVKLTEAQRGWLADHPTYSPVGRPRADVRFINVGTLYADGTFSRTGSGLLRNTIVLKPGCIGVGEKTEGGE